MSSHYDIVVLGSGAAGKHLAWTFASAGQRVALVERKYIGGSCPNVACLPSKNIIHSAKVAHYSKNASLYGLEASKRPIDLAVVRGRKRAMVDGEVEFHKGKFETSGAELILGEARFVGERNVEVATHDGKTRKLTADTIIISTGSHQDLDSMPGLRAVSPLTHVELLELDEVPRHLAVLGGGYQGLEFAQAYRRFGSEVTVIERHERLLPHEDEDVSHTLEEILRDEGINLITSAKIDSFAGASGSSVTVSGKESGKDFAVSASHLLATTGRKPNTKTLNASAANISLTQSGHIAVDEYLRSTSAAGIFAVGDCAKSPQFTHIAFDDFRIVRDQLKNKANSLNSNGVVPSTLRSTNGRQVPYVLFTDPELARIGLSEAAAIAQGIPYRLAKLPMAASLRATTLGETKGFMKALVGADDKVLGFTAVGVGAGEMLPMIQLVMKLGQDYTILRDLTVTHPTMTEGVMYLLMAVPAKA